MKTKMKSGKLGEYLQQKAIELGVSNKTLSKQLRKENSGSFIAVIRNGHHYPSEEKIRLIANFFNEEPNMMIFKARRIPMEIQEMIFDDEKLQQYLIKKLRAHRPSY